MFLSPSHFVREILLIFYLLTLFATFSEIHCHRSSYRTPDTRALNLINADVNIKSRYLLIFCEIER